MTETVLVALTEAAARLGVSPRTLWRWIAAGRIRPHKMVGDQRTMVDWAELAAALAAGARRGRGRGKTA